MLILNPSLSVEEHSFDLKCNCVFSSPHLQLLSTSFSLYLLLLWTLTDQILILGKHSSSYFQGCNLSSSFNQCLLISTFIGVLLIFNLSALSCFHKALDFNIRQGLLYYGPYVFVLYHFYCFLDGFAVTLPSLFKKLSHS